VEREEEKSECKSLEPALPLFFLREGGRGDELRRCERDAKFRLYVMSFWEEVSLASGAVLVSGEVPFRMTFFKRLPA